MISGRRILAVVPARGGSKGVPLKNLRPLAGVPLVARVGHLIREIPEIDRAVVSTDHEEIARVAGESGLAACFRRPPELSGDRIGDHPVLLHALRLMEQMDACVYDIVVMLQPTSPLRRKEHVTAALHKLVHEGWDAVWSVSPTDTKYHPLKQLLVSQDGSMEFYESAGKGVVARQELTPVYHRNGVVYAITRRCLLEHGTIWGERCGALIIDDPMISIDTEEDIRKVEKLMQATPGAPSTEGFIV